MIVIVESDLELTLFTKKQHNTSVITQSSYNTMETNNHSQNESDDIMRFDVNDPSRAV